MRRESFIGQGVLQICCEAGRVGNEHGAFNESLSGWFTGGERDSKLNWIIYNYCTSIKIQVSPYDAWSLDLPKGDVAVGYSSTALSADASSARLVLLPGSTQIGFLGHPEGRLRKTNSCWHVRILLTLQAPV